MIYVALIALVGIIPRPIDQGITPWVRGMLATMQRGGLPSVIDYDVVEYGVHFALFVPLGILLTVTLGRKLVWLALILGGLAGVNAEVWTSRLAEEPLSQLDLFLNIAGVVVGVAVGWWALAPYSRAGRAPGR